MMTKRSLAGLGTFLAAVALAGTAPTSGWSAEARTEGPVPGSLDRSMLPIPEPKRAPITEIDVRKAKAPPRFEVNAPKGAPNVVVVLIDDMGFGQPSTFGGGIS